VWRSEQRPELFEIGQGLTSEDVNGSAFEVMDIIASIVWFDKSRKWIRDGGWLDGCYRSICLGVSMCAICE